MSNRVLFTMLVLMAASPAAAEDNDGHNDGAKVDSATGASSAILPLAKELPTFVEFHSARVEKDLLLFQPTLVGITPPGRSRDVELFARTPVKKEIRFLAPVESAESVDVRRERDKLLLFRGPQPQVAAVGIGLAMFAAATILSAHAPRPFRVVFDGPVHLGPAIFDGGGMGAGIAGRTF